MKEKKNAAKQELKLPKEVERKMAEFFMRTSIPRLLAEKRKNKKQEGEEKSEK